LPTHQPNNVEHRIRRALDAVCLQRYPERDKEKRSTAGLARQKLKVSYRSRAVRPPTCELTARRDVVGIADDLHVVEEFHSS